MNANNFRRERSIQFLFTSKKENNNLPINTCRVSLERMSMSSISVGCLEGAISLPNVDLLLLAPALVIVKYMPFSNPCASLAFHSCPKYQQILAPIQGSSITPEQTYERSPKCLHRILISIKGWERKIPKMPHGDNPG